MKKIITTTLIGGTALLGLGLSACAPTPTEHGASTTSTYTQTVSAPAPVPAAVTNVTIPDLTGQNAEIAQKKLAALGLTDVVMASANPEYSMVILAQNWTVVSVEPGPGTTVKSSDPVVLKVTKP